MPKFRIQLVTDDGATLATAEVYADDERGAAEIGHEIWVKGVDITEDPTISVQKIGPTTFEFWSVPEDN